MSAAHATAGRSKRQSKPPSWMEEGKIQFLQFYKTDYFANTPSETTSLINLLRLCSGPSNSCSGASRRGEQAKEIHI